MQSYDRYLEDGFRHIANFFQRLSAEPMPEALYRGHADIRWRLAPSATREDAIGIDRPSRLKSWKRMAARTASPRPSNDLEWMAMAQHYGIPTTLLDWTTNPLIALFFATGEPGDVPGCVWRVSKYAFRTFEIPGTVEVFKQDRATPGLVDAATMNARSAAQDSALSIHSPETEFAPMRDEGGVIYQIEPDDKAAVRVALADMGVTEARLFVDMAVIVRNFQAHLNIVRLIEGGDEATRLFQIKVPPEREE